MSLRLTVVRGLLFFGALLPTVLSAQVRMPSVSADALAYGKYADIPVNQFTGTGSVTVPLHTLTDGPLSLPVFLQYHTAGLAVSSPASSVGLGWNLNAGGMISRTVMGIRDDHNVDGYLIRGGDIQSPGDYNHDNWGLEPDIYTYNFAGMAGKFFVDAGGVVRTVPQTDLRIELVQPQKNLGNHLIQQIRITAPDGTRYRFGSLDDQSGPAYDYSAYRDFVDVNENRTAYHLVQIESADRKHHINIEYREVGYLYAVQSVCPEETKYRTANGQIQTINSCSDGTEQLYRVRARLPQRIVSTYETLDFAFADRQDLNPDNAAPAPPPVRVTGLTVQNGATQIKWDFLQSYFKAAATASAAKRLKLDGVQRKSLDNSLAEPAWQFTYSGATNSDGSAFFPSTTDKNIDHWGYYNYVSGGANNTGDITPPTTITLGGQSTTYGTANRNSNEAAMLHGMLQRVTYPTGGSLTMTYQANRYQRPVSTTTALAMVSCGNGCVTEQNFTYTAAMTNNGRWDMCITPDPGHEYGLNSGRIQVFTASGNNLVSDFEFNGGEPGATCVDGPLPKIGYGSPNVPLTVGQTYRMRLTSYRATVRFNIKYDNARTDAVCGGLRIRQTRIHDGISAANDIVQDYRYQDKHDPSLTSGVLHRTPTYGFQLSPNTAVFTAYSMAPLSSFDGYHIGYDRVVIDKNGIGEEELTFHREPATIDYLEFPAAPPSFRLFEGTVKDALGYAEGSTSPLTHSTVTPSATANYVTYGNSGASGYIFARRFLLVSENGGAPVGKKYYTPYTITTGINRPGTVTSTVDGLTTTTTYGYHNNNLLPREVATTNSNGDVHKTVVTYSPEHGNSLFRNRFRHYNMVALPIKTQELYNNVVVDGTQTHYRFYTSAGTSPSTSTQGRDDVPRVYIQGRFERSWTATGAITGNGNTANTKTTILEYGSNGLPALYQADGWSTTRISYSGNLPTQQLYRSQPIKFEYYPGSSLLKERTAVDGTTVTHTYDALGRLSTTTDDCRNVVTTYDYHFTTGGSDRNYTEVTTNYPTPSANSALDVVRTRNYLDGLGRPVQTVARNRGSRADRDVVSAVEYDRYGRPVRAYEPREFTNNAGNYQTPSASWGFTQTSYEAGPLGRPLSVTPPNWASTTSAYGTNTTADKVRINAGGTNYAPGLLAKHLTQDGNGNQHIVFTDRRGRRVLSRRAAASGAETTWLDTYYLYDGKDRVTKVVPPGATVSSTPKLVYTYLYDGRDNLLEKTVPGRDKELFRYSVKDRMVARQDAHLRASSNRWYVHQYDDYGRERKQGFFTGTLPTGSGLNTVAPTEPLIETEYGDNVYDRDKVTRVRTKIMDGGSNWLSTTSVYDPCGVMTSQWGNNHLDHASEASETTTYAYDGALAVTASTYTHRALGQTHTVTAGHHYDFAGRSAHNEFRLDAGPLRKINKFVYDAKDQVAIKYQGGTGLSGSLEYLQKIDYAYLPNGLLQGINANAAGKLSGSQVALPANGATAASPAPARPSASDYDDRDLFQLELYRRTQAPGILTATFPARHNGDIVAVASQVRGRQQQVWAVQYDAYDRLRTTAFYQRSGATSSALPYANYREDLTYDPRGNILTLQRDGTERTGANYHQRSFDRLSYVYAPGTNRLTDVHETTPGSPTLGYRPGTADYTYDGNGNQTADPSRGVTQIEYNHQDLPTRVRWGATQRLELTYDAAGTLLRRRSVAATGAVVETRDYVGGMEYRSTGGGAPVLESVYHAEGRIALSGTAQEWQYTLTDHLGNTRLVYADRLAPYGIIDVPTEIVQEEHYYPFGMKLTGPWLGGGAGAVPYQYNGIEHVTDFGLDVDMAMYRTLDPTIGRWWSVDPKAEAVESHSPYVSMGNSPIVYSDPDGDLPFIAELAGLTNGVRNVLEGENFFEGFGQGWSQSWQITGGLFQYDNDLSFGQNIWNGVSKLTWEFPQTALGFATSQALNVGTVVNDVNYFRGATVIDSRLSGGAFTAGSFIVGPEGFKPDFRDHLFVHEFGHYLQSKRLGPGYLPSVAGPSVTDFWTFPDLHDTRWYEADASRRAANYFDREFGQGVDGFVASDPRFFDRASFIQEGRFSPYRNPRNRGFNFGGHPIQSQFHWSDIPINILWNGRIGLLGYAF